MKRLILLLSLATAPIAAAQAETVTLQGNFLPAVLASSKPHRESLQELIHGQRGIPTWVRNMIRQPRYVALASEKVEIEGKPMQLFEACEPGRCEASRLHALYSEDGKRVTLRISDIKLGEKLFGQPSASELQALGR